MATNLSTLARANLRQNRTRFALTSLSLAISAFFLTAIFLLTATMNNTLRGSVEASYAGSDAVVEASPSGEFASYLTQGQADQLASSALVASSWAQAVTSEEVGFKNGQGVAQNTYAARYDLPGQEAFPYQLAEGSWPTAENQVLISSALASTYQLAVGQEVTLTNLAQVSSGLAAESAAQAYTVSGIYQLPASFGPMSNAIFTPGQRAAEATAALIYAAEGQEPGIYSQVLVTLAEGASVQDLRDQLQAAGYQNLQVTSSQEKIEQALQEATGSSLAMTLVLSAFALLALLMSGFVISNTYRVQAATRAKELGLLRTLGASQKALVRMVLTEASWLALFSSLAGIALAYGLAFVVGSSQNLTVSYSPSAGLVALLVALAVTLLSALAPARASRSVSPIAALTQQEEIQPQQAPSSRKLLLIPGVILLLMVIAGAVVSGSALLYFLATLLFAVTSVMVFPRVLAPLLKLVTRPAAPYSTVQLAQSNIDQSPVQAAASGRMLFLSAAVLAAVFTGYSTVQQTFISQIEKNSPFALSGQISVSSQEAGSLTEELRGLENVTGALVAPLTGQARVTSQEQSETLPVYAASAQDYARVAPSSVQASINDQQILVGLDAPAEGWEDGATVTVSGSQASVDLTVKRVQTPLEGTFVSPAVSQQISGSEPLTLTSISGNSYNSLVLVKLEPGLSASERQDFVTAISQIPAMSQVQTGTVYTLIELENQMQVILLSVLALLLAALLVSLIGIANTQVLNAYQRRRAYALLRVTGLSTQRLRALITCETLLIAAGSLTLGVVAGSIGGLLFLQVMVTEGVGLSYSTNPLALLGIILLGLALAWAAAFLPAHRASQVPPVEALRVA